MTLNKSKSIKTSGIKRPNLKELVSRKKLQDEKAAGGNFYIRPGCPLPKLRINKPDTEYFIDIIPWQAGPTDPFVEEGGWQFRMDIRTHYHDDKQYVCPKSWGTGECPFCEERRRLIDAGEEKSVYAQPPYQTKSRELYQVVDVSSETSKAKGPQIMEVSSFMMSEKIKGIEKIIARPGQQLAEEDSMIFYYDTENGKTLYFKTIPSPKGNGQWQAHHKFLDRNYAIEDSILEATIDLAQWIEVKSYDELFFALHGEHPQKSEKSRTAPKAEAAQEEEAEASWDNVQNLPYNEKVDFIMDNDVKDEDGDILPRKTLKKMSEEELDNMIKAFFGVEDEEDDADVPDGEEDEEALEDVLELSLKEKAQYIVDNEIPDADDKTYTSAIKVKKAFDEDEIDQMITDWFEAAAE